jgi:hypothetical protein
MRRLTLTFTYDLDDEDTTLECELNAWKEGAVAVCDVIACGDQVHWTLEQDGAPPVSGVLS